MEPSTSDFMDYTVLTTPKPRACSTDRRQPQQKKPALVRNPDLLRKLSMNESLGILSLNDVDLTPSLETPRESSDSADLSAQLLQQRVMAESALNRIGLPSIYMKTMLNNDSSAKSLKSCESASNATDLMSSYRSQSEFTPSDISTPRNSSCAKEPENNTSFSNYADNISVLSEKIKKNTDMSIKDLCEEFKNFSTNKSRLMNSDMFLSSADLASEKLLEDEHNWKQERDLQHLQDSLLSSIANSTAVDEKHSMGEFFRIKSEDCSNIFMKKSPEKAHNPVALIELSTSNNITETTSNQSDNSLMSLSNIAKMLASESIKTPTKIVKCLLKNEVKRNTSGKVRDLFDNDDFKENLQSSIKSQKESQKRDRNSLQNPSKLVDKSRHSFGTSQQQQSTNSFLKTEEFVVQNSRSSLENPKGEYTDMSSLAQQVSLKLGTSEESLSSCKTSLEDLSENKDRMTKNDRSVTSLRSGSSLDNLVDGKLPIESTKIELVWAVVKVGKSSSQEFIIRNKVHQKIRFQIIITGSSFKISRSESEPVTSLTVLLHPLESRSFSILFTPTRLGAHVDRLHFQTLRNSNPTTSSNTQTAPRRQKILLYGYGGHCQPDLRHISKDSTGKNWLALGCLDVEEEMVERSFSFVNGGSLAGFVYLEVALKHLQVFTGLRVEPKAAVVSAGETVVFRVKYTPIREDLQRLKTLCSVTGVLDIATVTCVFGAEVLRGRIRRLARKLHAQNAPVDRLVSKLAEPFPNEEIPHDVIRITESLSSLKYLVQQLYSKDVIVTVEQDMDKTLVPGLLDDTSMFQTLTDAHTTVIQSHHPCDYTHNDASVSPFHVQPRLLILSPAMKDADTLFITNNGAVSVQYEVQLSRPLVRVTPEMGVVLPGNTEVVRVACVTSRDREESRRHERVKLTVFGENVSVEVDVQIMFINNS